MKYFTPELWRAINSDDPIERDNAEQSWDKNNEAYGIEVQKISQLLGKPGRFFREHSLHDGTLLTLDLGDFPLTNLNKDIRDRRHQTSIRIAVLAWNDKGSCHTVSNRSGKTGTNGKEYVYWLRYRGIISFTAGVKTPVFPEEKTLLGTWGYDELLLSATSGAFQHNILFSTGYEMQVEFSDFKFSEVLSTECSIRGAIQRQ